MLRHSPSLEPLNVDSQKQITKLCEDCRREGRFAFDTEFVMEDRYETEVCLIQMATQSTVALIDPFLELDLVPVWELVSDEKVETVVHAGQEDLALCVQHTGRVPRKVFDVQIAAGLVGHDYPLSLQRLVQTTMHIRLHKAKTLTNWRQRPLTKAQLGYAAEDVAHLLAVRKSLGDDLARLGRMGWAREEFARFEEETLYRRVEEEKILRIKGAGSLRGRQLAILHELFTWRDETARRLNRPARVVLKDHLLVEIARQSITQYAEVRDLRGINLSDRDVHAICGVVEKASAMPEKEWPRGKPHEVEPSGETALVALVTAVIRGYCLAQNLSYALVATQKTIRDLVRHRTIGTPASEKDVDLLRGWRGASVGQMVDEVLAGKRSIHVDSVRGEQGVRISLPES